MAVPININHGSRSVQKDGGMEGWRDGWMLAQLRETTSWLDAEADGCVYRREAGYMSDWLVHDRNLKGPEAWYGCRDFGGGCSDVLFRIRQSCNTNM